MKSSCQPSGGRFSGVSIFLLLILAGSLILNLWGIGYGLPDKYYPDEGRIIDNALAFGTGDFNPHYFNYPALTMYLLFFIYGFYFLVGRLAGFFSSLRDFQLLFFSNPSSFYLLGRVWVAVTGVAVVALVYRVGKMAFKSQNAGLFAALLLAPLSYFVYHCHFVVTDILLLFFLLLSYLFILGIYRSGKIGYYLAAGAAAGLGIATKYSPILLILPIFLAHIFHALEHKKQVFSSAFILPLVAAFGVMLLFFFIGSPYCFLDYGNFLASLQFRQLYGKKHTFGTGTGTAWLDYPRLLFNHSFLVLNRVDPLGIIFLLGLVWSLFRRTKIDFLLLSFPLALYLLMGSWTSGSSRYALPLVIFLAVLGGRAVAEIAGLLSHRVGNMRLRRLGVGSLYGFIALSVSLSAINTVLRNYRITQPDTRSLAREWIGANIPPGAKIALEWDTEATVQLWETPDDIMAKIKAYEAGEAGTIHHSSEQMAAVHRMRLAAVPEQNYRIIRVGGMDGVTVKTDNYSLEELRERGTKYLVTSGEVTGIFASERGREIYPRQADFYKRIERELIQVKEFLPDPLARPGPAIKIYRF